MSYHLTYVQAVVTGLVQGVTELFPVSSLGHNVLLPALIGGSWAQTLNVSAPGSPYLAFIVGLHVATAVAMIAFFWRDWLRIVRGFFSSIGQRRIATPDQRLAWLIILGTIPVGIVGVLVQKEFTKVFAKPELAATFLAINGLILLASERMRRRRDERDGGASRAGRGPRPAFDGPAFDGPGSGGPGFGGPGSGGPGSGAPGSGGLGSGGRSGRPAGGPPPGYTQQPRQQQWQGPDPRYGQDEWQRRDDQQRRGDGQRPGGVGRHGRRGPDEQEQYGQEQYGQEQYRPGGAAERGGQYGQQSGQQQSRQQQYGQQQSGQDQYPQGQYGQEQNGRGEYGREQYRPSEAGGWDGQPGQPGQPGQGQYGRERSGHDQYGQAQYGQEQYGRDARGGRGQQPAGGAGYGQQSPYGQQPQDDRSGQDVWRDQARQQEGGPRGGGDPWAAQQRQPGGQNLGGQNPDGRNLDGRNLGGQQPTVRRGRPGDGRPGDGRPGDGRPGDGRPGSNGAGDDPAVAADGRLSTIGFKRALFVGAAQILALLPGISRDGIVTVAGMGRGLTRSDAVRFSFLLSAPVILAAGVLKASDLTGPEAKGIHGPIIVGSIIAGVGAYLSIRFLTKYFSEDKSLNPFGYYCIIAGLASLAYLVLK